LNDNSGNFYRWVKWGACDLFFVDVRLLLLILFLPIFFISSSSSSSFHHLLPLRAPPSFSLSI